MSATQPSRALLIAAGALTQLIGAACLVLALAAIPVVIDQKSGMTGVLASVIAALAAMVCGTLVWRGRLVPLALAAGLDVGFGIGLPRGGSAIGAVLRMLPADELQTAQSLVTAGAIIMFAAAILCVLAVPSALKLRQWARDELAASGMWEQAGASGTLPEGPPPGMSIPPIDETAPTRERPRLGEEFRPSALRHHHPSQAQLPLPAPPPEPGPAGTLRGIGAKLIPTQVIYVGPPRKGKTPVIVVGVAVTLLALGMIVFSAVGGGPSRTVAAGSGGGAGSGGSGGSGGPSAGSTGAATAGSGSDAAASAGAEPASVAAVDDAGVDAGPVRPPVEEAIARLHEALGTGAAADLALLFDSRAFAVGVEANDLAEGRDAVVSQLRDDIGPGGAVSVKFSHVGQEGDVAWVAEDLRVGSRSFVMTAVLGLRDGAWTIGALHWAEAMPNSTAYRLARTGELSLPDAIPNTNDTSPLANAMRTAFASRPSFVDARSTRADAFNFGSAPGERLKGGEAIRKIFGRINAIIRLHDAVKVGMVGDSGGWGVANVDFTDTDRDGTEVTQTFRVLAAWVKEPDAGWRIVLTQWSNAK